MKTILLVEDNDAIREDVADILALANYKVITAKNGKEGIEKSMENIPDLIVSDIMMPVLDGFGMLHMLRRDPKTEAIPVIFLTAKTERNDIRNAMESGADDFITKPFNNDELLKAIENRFRKMAIMTNKISHDIQGINELLEVNNDKLKQNLETLSKDRDINIYQKNR